MSASMLNDTLHINNINPFWSEPPGSWTQPYNYTPTVKNVIEREPEDLTVGGGDPRGVEYKCKLNRPLYPRRNIDGGLWTLEDAPEEPTQVQNIINFFKTGNNLMILLVLVLLLVFVLNNID